MSRINVGNLLVLGRRVLPVALRALALRAVEVEMIRRAYEAAVEQLRRDPHFPLLVPTLFEVAAQYRRFVPGAELQEVRERVLEAGLKVADWSTIAESTSGRRVMVA